VAGHEAPCQDQNDGAGDNELRESVKHKKWLMANDGWLMTDG
jgi:hypothetical protein